MIRDISLLLFIGLALGQDKNIALFDLTNNGLKPNEVRTLTDRLRTELVQLGKFKVVERSKIDDILKEQGFQLSGCVDECLIEVGNLLGATSIILGSIGIVGDIYTISARMVNTTTGEVEKAISYDSEYDIENLLKFGMRDCAYQLLKMTPTNLDSEYSGSGEVDIIKQILKFSAVYLIYLLTLGLMPPL